MVVCHWAMRCASIGEDVIVAALFSGDNVCLSRARDRKADHRPLGFRIDIVYRVPALQGEECAAMAWRERGLINDQTGARQAHRGLAEGLRVDRELAG